VKWVFLGAQGTDTLVCIEIFKNLNYSNLREE